MEQQRQKKRWHRSITGTNHRSSCATRLSSLSEFGDPPKSHSRDWVYWWKDGRHRENITVRTSKHAQDKVYIATYPLNDPRAARRLKCDAAVVAEPAVVLLLALWPIDVRIVIREKSTDLVFLIVVDESGDFGVCIWLSHSMCLPLELTRNIILSLWREI